MSNEDRERWDARYREGSHGERTWPSALLQQWLDARDDGRLPRAPHALDLACGTGRNAIALARAGFVTTGMDVSGEGLRIAGSRATAANVEVTWLQADLETKTLPQRPWHLIVVFRYLNLPLFRELPQHLLPGGTLIIETHLQVSEDDLGRFAGPGTHRFRAAPGAIAAAVFEGARRDGVALVTALQENGPFEDPDGSAVALSRLIVQRTP